MYYSQKFLIIAFVVSFLFSSCESFDDGGLIKKADDRILSNWVLDGYYRNGVDETKLIFISNYSESYSDGGIYTRSYINGDEKNIQESGSWSFDSDEVIHIGEVSSINEFSAANSTLSSSTHNIIRLKKDELWYVYENGGDTHEFHFSKR